MPKVTDKRLALVTALCGAIAGVIAILLVGVCIGLIIFAMRDTSAKEIHAFLTIFGGIAKFLILITICYFVSIRTQTVLINREKQISGENTQK